MESLFYVLQDGKVRLLFVKVLMALIEDNQDVEDSDSREVIEEWKREVTTVQISLKSIFNSQFGSAFRSYNNPTYFSRKLFRYIRYI